MVEGQADKTVKTGESYQIPPGAIHDAKTGPNGAKVIATYIANIVEKESHSPLRHRVMSLHDRTVLPPQQFGLHIGRTGTGDV